MSTPVLSEPALATDPTHQQLDELEALIERMLELPFAQLESPPANRASSETALDAAPVLELDYGKSQSQLNEGTATVSAKRLDPVGTLKSPPAVSQAALPSVPDALDQDALFEQSFDQHAESATIDPPAIQQPAESEDRQQESEPVVDLPAAEERERGTFFALVPFVWLNSAFDMTVAPFGPLGRWLRAAGGRALLGWTGIVLLAIAAALASMEWLPWKV